MRGKYIKGEVLEAITDIITNTIGMLNDEHMESFESMNADENNKHIDNNIDLCKKVIEEITKK